ncbi:MAG: hypothetical protein AB7I59_00860 [Geminicoccaceae bacterium]
MKDLKRALLDGALVVLPIGAVVLLVLGIVRRLEHAADPLAGRFVHPANVAAAALVMDELADGRLLVFVPGSPAPMSGAIYIFTPDRVTLLDVPLLPFMKAISPWGLGLREMVEAAQAPP